MSAGSGTRARELVHVPALDGLRGIAILLVLAYHSGFIRGGWLGVDLFFVLSGFLITSLLLSERAATGTVSLGSFYRRRAFRLVPALLSMLAVYVAFVVATGSRAQIHATLESAALGLTYTMNVHNYFVASGAPDWALNHLWSLATEEQFYLLWPPLLALLLARSVRPRVVLAVLGGGALVAAVVGPWLPTWADAILVGCVAGVVFTHSFLPSIPRVARWAALLAATALALFESETRSTFHNAPVITLFALAAAVLLLTSATHADWWFVRVVSNKQLCYVGAISYGLYVWHLVLFKAFVGWPLGLPATFAVAVLSHRFLEQPLRRRGRNPKPASTVSAPPSRSLPEKSTPTSSNLSRGDTSRLQRRPHLAERPGVTVAAGPHT